MAIENLEQRTGVHRRKWRPITKELMESVEVTPRDPQSAYLEIAQAHEDYIFENVRREFDFESRLSNESSVLLETENVSRLRHRKRHAHQKPHRAVRDKWNMTTPRAKGRTLFMSARNYKKIGEVASRLRPLTGIPQFQQTPRGPNYLTQGNLQGSGIGSDLAQILLDLQDREITPEDYETLLQLDKVQASSPEEVRKRVGVLSRWMSHPADEELVDPFNEYGGRCIICMDCFEQNQRIKTLLCEHSFHSECLSQWVSQFALTCPLDNLSILSMRPPAQGRVSFPQGPLRVFKLPALPKSLRKTKAKESEDSSLRGSRLVINLERKSAIGIGIFSAAVLFYAIFRFMENRFPWNAM